MPLKEFTEKEVSGLRQGNVHIPVGTAAEGYEKYNEKDKLDQVVQFHQRMQALRK
jgi:hypothetical protein